MTRPNPPSDREPVRMLDEHGTPDALREALQALRERAPTPAASARIRRHIANPPAATHGGARSTLAIGLLALLGAAAWSAWSARDTVDAPASAAPSEALALPPQVASEARAAEPPGAPRSDRAPRAAAPGEALAAQPQLQAQLTEASSRAVEPAPQPAIAAKRPRPPLAPRASSPPKAEPVVATLEPAAPAPVQRTLPPPQPAVQGEDAERVFADPQDEAGLLYRAKRLSSSDPQAALRLLVLHEASFPDGAFGQERDMLEIKIHERLGHAATAKRLAALFKQRYPESVYRVGP